MQLLECRGDIVLLGVCSPFVLEKWSADNTGMHCGRETRPWGTLKPSECAVGSHCADGPAPEPGGVRAQTAQRLPRCPRLGQGCLPGSAGQEDVRGVSATCASSARAGHVEQQPRGIWGRGRGCRTGVRRLRDWLEGPSARGEGVMEEMGARQQAQAGGSAAGASALWAAVWAGWQPWGRPMGLLPTGSCLPCLRTALTWAPGGALEKGGILGENGPGLSPASRGLARPVWAQAVREAGAPLLQALATGSPALSPDPGPAGQGCARWQRSCELGSPASQGLS